MDLKTFGFRKTVLAPYTGIQERYPHIREAELTKMVLAGQRIAKHLQAHEQDKYGKAGRDALRNAQEEEAQILHHYERFKNGMYMADVNNVLEYVLQQKGVSTQRTRDTMRMQKEEVQLKSSGASTTVDELTQTFVEGLGEFEIYEAEVILQYRDITEFTERVREMQSTKSLQYMQGKLEAGPRKGFVTAQLAKREFEAKIAGIDDIDELRELQENVNPREQVIIERKIAKLQDSSKDKTTLGKMLLDM